VRSLWAARFDCAPRYVVGLPWEAGVVGLYGGKPLDIVLVQPNQALDAAAANDLARHGAIVVGLPGAVPQHTLHVAHAGMLPVDVGRSDGHTALLLAWQLIAPRDCHAD
jgi:hypothetical protein